MEYPTQIRAVIFDLGGVILRTDDPGPRIRLAEKMDKTRGELEDLVFGNPVAAQAERGQASEQEVWDAIGQSLNLPTAEVPAFRKAFFAGDRVDFELIRLIQALRGHYRTVLLSNTWIVDLPAFLRDSLQISETFDVVISSAERRMAKPDAEIFYHALDLVQAKPEEAIFVDDNLTNIQAASALGIRTVRFFSLDQVRRDMAAFIEIPL